jgi:hypothetical protein
MGGSGESESESKEGGKGSKSRVEVVDGERGKADRPEVNI